MNLESLRTAARASRDEGALANAPKTRQSISDPGGMTRDRLDAPDWCGHGRERAPPRFPRRRNSERRPKSAVRGSSKRFHFSFSGRRTHRRFLLTARQCRSSANWQKDPAASEPASESGDICAAPFGASSRFVRAARRSHSSERIATLSADALRRVDASKVRLDPFAQPPAPPFPARSRVDPRVPSRL